MLQRTVIIGRGHWGKALATLFGPISSELLFFDSSSSSREWTEAFSKIPLVVMACPFRVMPKVLQRISRYKVLGIINASKGIDKNSLLTFTQLAEKLFQVPLATLSGPTFAKEVLEKKPTASVLASRHLKFAKQMAQLISNSSFRVYASADPLGVEASGAMKNVLAIACGISDGLKLGMNARAALLTRGLTELQAVVQSLDGNPSTAFGLAGVGDLWLTATGDLSRNRQLGIWLAKGLSVSSALKKIDGVCEGLYTVKQVHRLAKKHGLELPISEQVYQICFKKQNPKKALLALMTRELKIEA